ncbi:hypothetical protein VTO42DRAFT_565 [Malbranchea cinnamomea]
MPQCLLRSSYTISGPDSSRGDGSGYNCPPCEFHHRDTGMKSGTPGLLKPLDCSTQMTSRPSSKSLHVVPPPPFSSPSAFVFRCWYPFWIATNCKSRGIFLAESTQTGALPLPSQRRATCHGPAEAPLLHVAGYLEFAGN